MQPQYSAKTIIRKQKQKKSVKLIFLQKSQNSFQNKSHFVETGL